jgi:hypothetical protein
MPDQDINFAAPLHSVSYSDGRIRLCQYLHYGLQLHDNS